MRPGTKMIIAGILFLIVGVALLTTETSKLEYIDQVNGIKIFKMKDGLFTNILLLTPDNCDCKKNSYDIKDDEDKYDNPNNL